MGRQPKLSQAREHLSIRLDPHVEYDFSRYARWAGVTRCELGRMVVEQAVQRFKKHGRSWVKRQMAEHIEKIERGGSAGAVASVCRLTECIVNRRDEAPVSLGEIRG